MKVCVACATGVQVAYVTLHHRGCTLVPPSTWAKRVPRFSLLAPSLSPALSLRFLLSTPPPTCPPPLFLVFHFLALHSPPPIAPLPLPPLFAFFRGGASLLLLPPAALCPLVLLLCRACAFVGALGCVAFVPPCCWAVPVACLVFWPCVAACLVVLFACAPDPLSRPACFSCCCVVALLFSCFCALWVRLLAIFLLGSALCCFASIFRGACWPCAVVSRIALEWCTLWCDPPPGSRFWCFVVLCAALCRGLPFVLVCVLLCCVVPACMLFWVPRHTLSCRALCCFSYRRPLPPRFAPCCLVLVSCVCAAPLVAFVYLRCPLLSSLVPPSDVGCFVWFGVFFCPVLCCAGVVVPYCLVCCRAVLSLAARFLLVLCELLFGVVLRPAWCPHVLLCAAVFSLALCGALCRLQCRFAVLSGPPPPRPAAALVLPLCPASCLFFTCPAVRVVLCCGALVLLRFAAHFGLCCCRCLLLWCVGVCSAVSFGFLWCGGVALLCGVVCSAALALFAVLFCAVLCCACVVVPCCLVCCRAVLLMGAPFLLVLRWCRAVPCCAVLFGAMLHRVWCRRALLRALVFSLALCGVVVGCVVWCAVVPCRVMLVLLCCPALPLPPLAAALVLLLCPASY